MILEKSGNFEKFSKFIFRNEIPRKGISRIDDGKAQCHLDWFR